ncbi:hypothetical protein FBU30_005158 [Linnemannia zychae]|nr:hypothetical protein FBU30_005158 [Linnemannia zychae]
MRFSPRTSHLWTTLATLALSFEIFITTDACERQCQLNVSHAFADKYQLLSASHFAILSQKIGQSLFYGVPSTAYSPTEASNAILHLQEAVVRAQHVWDAPLFRTIFDTIFVDEPKFKGDCNEPHRVDQPPLGVNWTMSDCHAMDYICGNPPSICHFMPMIKARIEKKLTEQLATKIGGDRFMEKDGKSSIDDGDVYANFLGPALSKLVMTHPKLEPYTATLHGNLNQILEVVRGEIVKEMKPLGEGGTIAAVENERWKPEWDIEIKLLLLSFP